MSTTARRRGVAAFFMLVAGVCATSCGNGKDSTAARRGPPASLTIISGDAQSGVVGQALPKPAVVKVVDANGNPVPGQAVNFRVTAGGGSVFAGASVTNQGGVAQERWTLGTVAGAEQTLEARAVDNSTGQALVFATFHATATADVTSTLKILTQPPANARSGQPLPIQPAVQVADKYGNPVAQGGIQITVSIASPDNGRSLSGATTASTNASGIATFTDLAILGSAGSVALAFAAHSLASATSTNVALTAGVPTQLVAVGPTALTGTVGAPVTPLPRVAVRDAAGNPEPLVSVTFAISDTGGAVSPTSTLTDASGEAALISWTLPQHPGTVTVVANASAIPGSAVVFTATALAGAAKSLAIVTQSPSQAGSGTTLTPAPAVRRTDSYGNAITQSGAIVRVAVSPASYSLSGTTSVQTDAQGLATFSNLAVVGAPGNAILTFSSDGVASVSSQAIALAPGSPVSLAATSSTTLSVVAGQPLVPLPAVIVKDDAGNGVPNVSISFALSAGAGTIAPTTAVTNAQGVAALTSWALPTKVGSYSLQASLGQLPPVTFTATVKPATLSALDLKSGGGQTAPALAPLPDSVTVRATDQFGNAVPGATVTWTTTSDAAASRTTSTTDTSGLAATQWSLGTIGADTLIASSNGKTALVTAIGTLPANATLTKSTGDNQSAVTNAQLTQPVTVLLSSGGRGVRGARVNWTVTSGGGYVSPNSSSTDASGHASAAWGLGPSPGTNTVSASVPNGPGTSFTATATGPSAPPTLHWTSDTLSGPQFGIFEAVSGTSSSNVVAAGSNQRVVHFDGVSWTDLPQVPTPGQVVEGIYVTPTGAIYASMMGSSNQGIIDRYTGTAWQQMVVTTGNLYGIWGFSDSDIFAVGTKGTIMHFDGTTWSRMAVSDTFFLRGVWGSSPTNVFAVGNGNVLLHYDGVQWTQMASPQYIHYMAVWGRSATDVFAVGDGGAIAHYDGTSWRLMQSGTTQTLAGVGGTPQGGVFAVGWNSTLLSFDGANWTQVIPTDGNSITAIWGSPTGDVLAVGAPWRIVRGTP